LAPGVSLPPPHFATRGLRQRSEALDYPLIQLERTKRQTLMEPKSNNGVTFPIRCAARVAAIPSANKHINSYEND